MGGGFDWGSYFNDFVAKNASGGGGNPFYAPPSGEPDADSAAEFLQGENYRKLYEETLSDFNSYRKRVENSREIEKRNTLKELILGFLEIVDFVQYVYKSKDTIGKATHEDLLLLNKLKQFLSKYGVEPIGDCIGKPFDHNLHEAVMTDSSHSAEKGVVTAVLSTGFTMGGEVIKHAKVVVSD